MDFSPPIRVDILLNNWDKVIPCFADFPGALNLEYILNKLKTRKAILSTVTELDVNGTCPLLEFLRSPNCSSEVLKLLFLNGVDVNIKNANRCSALVIALYYHARNASIIKVILEAGADVDTLRFYERCALCVAVKGSATPDVIKMLLRAGCRPNCGEPFPTLIVAVKYYPDPKCRREVLKLLIDSGASVDALSFDGRSVLCNAFHRILSKEDVHLLIGLGLRTDMCTMHSSPILCYLDNNGDRTLPADVAELLLGPFENPMSGHDYLYILPREMTRPRPFTPRSLEPWFKLQREEARVEGEYGTLLHAVTYNAHCTQDLVELLAKRGVPVDKQSSEKETPVHVALKRVKHLPNVLGALLKWGCPVDALDWAGRTALACAVLLEKDSKVLKVLLDGGARVTQAYGSTRKSVLEMALEHHSKRICLERLETVIRMDHPNIPGRKRNWLYLLDEYLDFEEEQKRVKWDCLEILFLYSFLENPDLDIERLTEGREDELIIKHFARKCLDELKELEQKEVGNGYTLLEFISRRSLEKMNVDHNFEENRFDFDQLVRILADTKLTKYLDMVFDQVPRELMEGNLHQLQMYSTSHRNHQLKIFVLNCQCVSEIAKYLSSNDLMKLILAFHNCVIPTASVYSRNYGVETPSVM